MWVLLVVVVTSLWFLTGTRFLWPSRGLVATGRFVTGLGVGTMGRASGWSCGSLDWSVGLTGLTPYCS